MAGHTLTPYELTATRKFARKEKKLEQLLLASIGEKSTVDLLDAVEANITTVNPLVSADKTKTFSCTATSRDGETLGLVFASDVSGEREVVHDGALPGRPVVFTKGRTHVTRFYSCCAVWRPAAASQGLLLVHSPWGRGGNKGQVMKLLQRAVDAAPDAKAKLQADPMVPAKALQKMLRQANATKIIYSRSTGVTSNFGDTSAQQSAPAEMDLVVKGSDSIPFRDALKAALRAKTNREKLFTVRIRDADGKYREETFEDVSIDLSTAGGVRRYSMRHDSIPTLGFNLTPEVNNVYYALPANKPDGWATGLLGGVFPHLQRVIRDVALDI